MDKSNITGKQHAILLRPDLPRLRAMSLAAVSLSLAGLWLAGSRLRYSFLDWLELPLAMALGITGFTFFFAGFMYFCLQSIPGFCYIAINDYGIEVCSLRALRAIAWSEVVDLKLSEGPVTTITIVCNDGGVIRLPDTRLFGHTPESLYQLLLAGYRTYLGQKGSLAGTT